jgi:DNA-binding FadR family transcriptional regulator
VLAQASGNDRLAQIMRSLARQSWRYTQLALGDALRRQESARNWRSLFEALSQGQNETAGQAMEKLVEDARLGAVRLLNTSAVMPSGAKPSGRVPAKRRLKPKKSALKSAYKSAR